MALLHEAIDEKRYDIRVVERNVDRGVIKSEEADKVSKALPDDSENAGWTNIEELAAEEQTSRS